eukprot:6745925-Alexandrium_andersonii.AAC.1
MSWARARPRNARNVHRAAAITAPVRQQQQNPKTATTRAWEAGTSIRATGLITRACLYVYLLRRTWPQSTTTSRWATGLGRGLLSQAAATATRRNVLHCAGLQAI